jgi:ferredoxin
MAYFITDTCIGCSVCIKVCPVDAIEGKRKKLHKIKKDECIDCGACGKICPQESVKDHTGKICKRIRRRANWEKPAIDLEKCMSCMACIEACPVDCLGLSYTQDTTDKTGYPFLKNKEDCIACRFCAVECPVDAVKMVSFLTG